MGLAYMILQSLFTDLESVETVEGDLALNRLWWPPGAILGGKSEPIDCELIDAWGCIKQLG